MVLYERLRPHTPMAKRGPKGPWKVKGAVREELMHIFRENASTPSDEIADTLFQRTGTKVSDTRVREIRLVWKKGSSMKPTPTVPYPRRAQAHQSSSP